MLDLPVSDVEAAIEKEFASKEGGMLGMFVRRVSSQLVQLRTFVGHLLGLQDGGALGSRTDMVKDPFGLHKLIVVVTRVAKIYGIDNKNGEIVWQYLVKDVEPCSTLGKLNVPLYIQRTTRVLPHPAQWTMLFRHKVTKNSVLFVFNPINGYPLSGVIELGYKVVQAILLPAADSEFIKGLVLLSSSGRVDVFPPSTKQMALATAPTIFMYTIDPATGIVSGYTFAYSTATKELIATLVWNVKLPLNIVAVKGKNPQEKVHSQGRVLGDRSVLYKYINPNLVALATLSQDPIHKSVLSVFLLDVVSGRVILSVVHKRASEPIHVVHSENWVAYSYFNDKSRRTEMVALDLYEGKSQTNTTAFSSITQRIDPFIERQAYIFPYHILAMKETITEKGITSKHILVGLGSGGVMEVPWALLDPRRPVVPTMEMREEGVIPYMPELALPHEAIITYNHTLPNIAGIVTSPAGLESTCLVFVYGLDLFYTQVAPSKTFDVLKDDFEYWLISAVLVGLTLAAYITKRLASRKALRQAWK
ncbi:hypothetical protein AAG570_003376 [Ranatra chinensis]|uniref:ER membrane protein complex subunit 1 n=1 Tax=Ranatra chinensis TaxID=642074 RepID=A0ABD0Y3I2_9HEMI